MERSASCSICDCDTLQKQDLLAYKSGFICIHCLKSIYIENKNIIEDDKKICKFCSAPTSYSNRLIGDGYNYFCRECIEKSAILLLDDGSELVALEERVISNQWMKLIKKFHLSNYKNREILENAIAICNDVEIRKTLTSWPLNTQEQLDFHQKIANSLHKNGKKRESIILKLLIYSNAINSIPNYTFNPDDPKKRKWLVFLGSLAKQLHRYEEFSSNSASLYYDIGLCYNINNMPNQALTSYYWAEKIYRRLNLEKQEYNHSLACTLNNKGLLLVDTNRYVEAKSLLTEALVLKRKSVDMDSPGFTHSLMHTLSSLGSIYLKEGEFNQSNKLNDEFLTLSRQQVEEDPEYFYPYLATALSNSGILNQRNKNYEKAQMNFEEALGIRRSRAKSEKHDDIEELLKLLHNIVEFCSELRDFAECKKHLTESMKLSTFLVDKNRDKYLHYLAKDALYSSQLNWNERKFEHSINTAYFAVQMYRELVEKNSKYQETFVSLLNNVGVLFNTVNSFNAAEICFEEGLALASKLVKENTDVSISTLALTQSNYGLLLVNQEKYEDALVLLNSALKNRERLSKKKPGYLDDELAHTSFLIGMCYTKMGNLEASEDMLTRAELLRRKLFENKESAFAFDLCKVLNALGKLYFKARENSKAKSKFTEAINIAESINKKDNNVRLNKSPVSESYLFLLKEAILDGDSIKVFSYFIALRHGDIFSKQITASTLDETIKQIQNKCLEENSDFKILIASMGLDEDLLLGIVDKNEFKYFVVTSINWKSLFPKNDPRDNLLERQKCASENWKKLPKEVREWLIPSNNKNSHLVICGDAIWSAFPWELLQFSSGSTDYLGLHYALPRVPCILPEDINNYLTKTTLGSNEGLVSVLAPWDTNYENLLTQIIGEVDALKKVVNEKGARIISFSIGTDATDKEFERQIEMKPDVIYFCGHGMVVNGQEMLILHNENQKNARSPFCLYGKRQLSYLSEKSSEKIFPQKPLIVLNSCQSGRVTQSGGEREDLIYHLLSNGAGAVVASAMPIYDIVGKAVGESLFLAENGKNAELSSVIVSLRRNLRKTVCKDLNSPHWGAWGFIHLHGNVNALLPF